MSDGNALTLAEAANKIGFSNLRQSALHKVALGLTSLEEINRII
jgi:type IV pilus assembly protein PilB